MITINHNNFEFTFPDILLLSENGPTFEILDGEHKGDVIDMIALQAAPYNEQPRFWYDVVATSADEYEDIKFTTRRDADDLIIGMLRSQHDAQQLESLHENQTAE